MRILILTIFLLLSVQAVYPQFYNPDAIFDKLSVNFVFEENYPADCKKNVIDKFQEFVDDFNKNEKKAFTLVQSDESAKYQVQIYLDSVKIVTKGKKTLAWVFFGFGIPSLIITPLGAAMIFESLTLVGSNKVYMKTIYSSDLQGKNYKTITSMGTYNALFAKYGIEMDQKHCEKLPKAGFKYARDVVLRANSYYMGRIKKRQKK